MTSHVRCNADGLHSTAPVRYVVLVILLSATATSGFSASSVGGTNSRSVTRRRHGEITHVRIEPRTRAFATPSSKIDVTLSPTPRVEVGDVSVPLAPIDDSLSPSSSSQSTSAASISSVDTASLPLASSTQPTQLEAAAAAEAAEDYKRGLWTIAFITVLFSSNSPVLHAAFVSADSPPPVLLLNAATSVIALGGLIFGGPLLDATVPLPCTLEEDAALACDDALDERSVRAGLELGLWKMLGTTANLYGLSLTTAGHGAFLIQLTTLIVPAVQGVRGVPIPARIWTAIGLALSGVFLFTQEPSSAAAEAGRAATMSDGQLGDALCVLAAIFYATYDLRLFEWGKKVAPLRLITNKIAVQAALSLGLLLALGAGESAEYVSNLLATTTTSSSSSSPSGGFELTGDVVLVGCAALWSGLVINAIAPFLQVGGQQAVGASRAQVVYASQPLWAAILSWSLLGETVGPQGLVGGGMFLGAMYLAATAEMPNPNCGKDSCEV